jgi:hypothetical protein
LTIFSHETEQTIEINFSGYVRWWWATRIIAI